MIASTGGIGVPPALPNLNQLGVGRVHEAAVISYRWKIGTLSDLLRVFFFLNLIAGDANVVIVLER
jgi:hypothetical protein